MVSTRAGRVTVSAFTGLFGSTLALIFCSRRCVLEYSFSSLRFPRGGRGEVVGITFAVVMREVDGKASVMVAAVVIPLRTLLIWKGD